VRGYLASTGTHIHYPQPPLTKKSLYNHDADYNDSPTNDAVTMPICLPFSGSTYRAKEGSENGRIPLRSWLVCFINRLASPTSYKRCPLGSSRSGLVDCMGMPDAVYPLIWSFLLDSTSGTASSLDFKSISTLMLVNKTSKGTFDDCRGWWLCAQALKREATAKRLLIIRFQDWTIYASKLKLCKKLKVYKTPSYRENFRRARETNSRILSIQSTLLPEASRLAVLYGGDRVSMNRYRSIEKFIGTAEYHVSVLCTLDRILTSLGGSI
jgi:hypothetical protein